MARRGLEPINRSKTIKLDKHELKALFERNATERDEAQAAERVEGMGSVSQRPAARCHAVARAGISD